MLISLFYKREDIAELLINYGADVNTKNNEGYTPLIYSCNYNNSKNNKNAYK
ncbi:ankyrin repeat domain-containing protein [Brachyspira hyodysenteriae]|nr:ankyrin repeat domain-containing protein [Brachyspira hyodysenteriae]MDA1470031.1 ankyrin repeat domain-containing protein [Brachyspira hyodysenteriae]